MSKFKEDRERRAGGDMPESDKLSVMFAGFPEMFEALCGYRLPNGEDRPGMKLSIWVKNGQVKACFNDADTEQIGFCNLNNKLRIDDAVEEVLVKGPIDWSDNKFKGKR